MRKENMKYKLKVTTPIEYELEITLPCENKLFLKVFNKAKLAYLRKKGKKVGGDSEKINEFDIPREFLKLIKISLKRPFNCVAKIANHNEVILLDYEVIGAKFRRNDKNDWDICIKMEGKYVDKRC